MLNLQERRLIIGFACFQHDTHTLDVITGSIIEFFYVSTWTAFHQQRTQSIYIHELGIAYKA